MYVYLSVFQFIGWVIPGWAIGRQLPPFKNALACARTRAPGGQVCRTSRTPATDFIGAAVRRSLTGDWRLDRIASDNNYRSTVRLPLTTATHLQYRTYSIQTFKLCNCFCCERQLHIYFQPDRSFSSAFCNQRLADINKRLIFPIPVENLSIKNVLMLLRMVPASY